MIPPYLTVNRLSDHNLREMIFGVMPDLPRSPEGRYVAGSLAHVASTGNASALFFACAAAAGLWNDSPDRADADPIVAAAMTGRAAERLAFKWGRSAR